MQSDESISKADLYKMVTRKLPSLDDSSLVFERLIPAKVEEVWRAWTTEDGIKSFFAPECRINLRPGGAYEMYFNLDATPGERGGEDCRIITIDPPNMLSFTWNFPPEIPTLRTTRHTTQVVIRLTETPTGGTLVQLRQDGWGIGDDWEEGRRYFQRAWGEIVLPRLYQRFTAGPISWNDL